ncbi:hypothetical protein Q767_08010 [Flavobacterium enshiense DK69]|uniref:Uncharacterized protein n=1 Tax=Flavobacterium enshiense DK69 TaxID=1107311 RepID=A0A0A2MX85_9FLAO|nr:hypothetical protein Q767_08010 [Flavobacterium enshiense DK69]
MPSSEYKGQKLTALVIRKTVPMPNATKPKVPVMTSVATSTAKMMEIPMRMNLSRFPMFAFITIVVLWFVVGLFVFYLNSSK